MTLPRTAAVALALLLGPALLVGLKDYAEFRAERAIHATEHERYMSTVNGVDVGLGPARTLITADHPGIDGPEIWLDQTGTRKTCATLTMTAYRDAPDRYIRVACLDPETGEPIDGLTRARIWPNND